MIYGKHPCKPDCPNRSPTCRIKCEEYAKYMEWKEKIKAQIRKEYEVNCAMFDNINKKTKNRRKK